jgi:flavin-dependent dehydrogenase
MSPPVETIEYVVIGAGPAGLRAAQVLAGAGREVVVLEKKAEVGPKTCAGGLTHRAVRELKALGMAPGAGLSLQAHGSFAGEGVWPLESPRAEVRTLSRRRLGALQAEWARAAGAEIRTGVAASEFDFAAHTLAAGGRRVRYRSLIAADGSTSGVRRALGLPSPRAYFAAEFNVRGLALPRLSVSFDSAALANGYFWVFPHEGYTSLGAGAPKGAVPPASLRPYLERRAADLGVDLGATPYEGATIEVRFVGFDFPHGVHLVGDAAGCPDGLTAEGIYPALVTGEETARRILEPGYPSPKTAAWLRKKAAHDRLAAFWGRRPAREASFALLSALWGRDATRAWLRRVFL